MLTETKDEWYYVFNNTKGGNEMNSQKILELIPILEKIKNPEDFKIIQNAVDSCLTVQNLKERINKSREKRGC